MEREISELLDNFKTIDKEFKEIKTMDQDCRDRIDKLQNEKVWTLDITYRPRLRINGMNRMPYVRNSKKRKPNSRQNDGH